MISADAISDHTFDLLGIGFGPSNLAIAAAAASEPVKYIHRNKIAFLERREGFSWHSDTLFDSSRMQVVFLKDLVTLSNPCSAYSFVQYLFEKGRLEQFINQHTLYPTRREYHDYFCWAAEKLSKYVKYNSNVTSIRPYIDRDNIIDHYLVEYTDVKSGISKSLRTQNVVLSMGGMPIYPKVIDPSNLSSSVFHSSCFLSRMHNDSHFSDEQNQQLKYLVVGAGQSAAEIFYYLATRYKSAKISLAMRGYSLKPSDSSSHTNEIFNSNAIDFYYHLLPERRKLLRNTLRHTNYSVVDENLIDLITGLLYDQSVLGGERLSLLRMHELRECISKDRSNEVTLENLATGASLIMQYDVVIFATGYDFTIPPSVIDKISPFICYDEDGEIQMRRDYSVKLNCQARGKLDLQGPTEHTHGMTGTLISGLASRSRDILTSLSMTINKKQIPLTTKGYTHNVTSNV